MNPDRDLTILLTLKDRADYTFRWLAYAQQTRLPFKVLIADGGADESVPRALSDKSRFPDVDYDYLRFPYDASYSDYYAKIVGALDRVRTPYVVMADNDDFFFARALRQSVEFLATHPDYVACGGYSAVFWVDSLPGNAERRSYADHVQWKCSSELRSIEAQGADDRVRELACSYADAFYDVKRTSDARNGFAAVLKLDPSDLFLVELLVQFLSAIAGKIKRLDTLHIARQHDSPDSSGGSHERQHGDWLGRMLVDSWSREFMQFLDATAGALSVAEGIPVEIAREHIRSAYRMSVAPSLLSDLMSEPTVTPVMAAWIAAVRRAVKLPGGSRLRSVLRWVYRRSQWVPHEVVLGAAFVKVKSRGAAADFAPVREFLTRKPKPD